jgi:hypothetical protein
MTAQEQSCLPTRVSADVSTAYVKAGTTCMSLETFLFCSLCFKPLSSSVAGMRKFEMVTTQKASSVKT